MYVAHATGIDENLYIALQLLMLAHVDASISREKWSVDGVCVVSRAGHNTACIGSTRGTAYHVYIAKVAEFGTGFYIGLSSTGSLRNYSMTGCYVHCNTTRVVGYYRWVNILRNKSLIELCICTVQVGLRSRLHTRLRVSLIHSHVQRVRGKLSSVRTECRESLGSVYRSRVTGCV